MWSLRGFAFALLSIGLVASQLTCSDEAECDAGNVCVVTNDGVDCAEGANCDDALGKAVNLPDETMCCDTGCESDDNWFGIQPDVEVETEPPFLPDGEVEDIGEASADTDVPAEEWKCGDKDCKSDSSCLMESGKEPVCADGKATCDDAVGTTAGAKCCRGNCADKTGVKGFAEKGKEGFGKAVKKTKTPVTKVNPNKGVTKGVRKGTGKPKKGSKATKKPAKSAPKNGGKAKPKTKTSGAPAGPKSGETTTKSKDEKTEKKTEATTESAPFLASSTASLLIAGFVLLH